MRALHAVPWLALLLCGTLADAAAALRVERDIPYAFIKGDAAALRRQSFDLYLPAATKPPLVVFIHGGFWVESDDEYRIGQRIAEALVADGAAVALVRYRLSPQVRHPTQVRDVAAALAGLKRFAERYGYDPKRLYLVGHSAGATLAALLALDPTYLAEVGLKPADVAGAVLISGIYDLGPSGPLTSQHEKILAATFGSEPAARRGASPLTHVRSGPRLFVLSAANDFPGFAVDARRFVKALRAVGHRQVQELIVPGLNHFTIVDPHHKERLVRAILNGFTALRPLDAQTATLLQVRQRWQEPPFSTEPFWNAGVAVRSYPVDARLRAALGEIYEYNAYELAAYPLARYHAVDLFEYLNRLPPERAGSGDFLTITNFRGEHLYFTRAQLVAYRPQLVIGLDDERNLFRLSVFYQNKLEYSWRADKPPIMARSVGAFLHFIKEPPPNLVPDTRARFSLTPESFRFTPQDPLGAVASIPPEAHKVLTQTNACLSCHSFRGAGARAGHVEAATGKLHGGFALAFEEYPSDAWRRFIFEPEAAAQLIGVRANPVEGPAKQMLHDLVEAARASNSKKQ